MLVEADARRAKFVSTMMRNARLDGANLVRADLTNADLTGASLVGADLTSARLFGADLSRADLTGARLSRHRSAEGGARRRHLDRRQDHLQPRIRSASATAERSRRDISEAEPSS